MKQTKKDRIINLASTGVFNKSRAKKSFKGLTNEDIHNTVMRTARKLAEVGVLKRIGPGSYVRKSR